MPAETLRSTPAARTEVIKIFYIIRGVMRGLISNKHFNRFFDWFYPHYMSAIMEATLNAFYDDDLVVHVCFKLWIETV